MYTVPKDPVKIMSWQGSRSTCWSLGWKHNLYVFLCSPCLIFITKFCIVSTRMWWHESVRHLLYNKANLRDLIAATGLVILLKFWFKSSIIIFLWMTSFIQDQFLSIIPNPSVISNWSYSWEMLNVGKNRRFFCPVWPWNETDDLEKQQGTSSLCSFKLCASFHNQQFIQTGVIVRKRSIRIKIGEFFVPCELEIWRII